MGVVSMSVFGGKFILAKVCLGLVTVHCTKLRDVHLLEDEGMYQFYGNVNRPFARKRKYAQKQRDVTSGVRPWRTFTIAEYGENLQGNQEEHYVALLDAVYVVLVKREKPESSPHWSHFERGVYHWQFLRYGLYKFCDR